MSLITIGKYLLDKRRIYNVSLEELSEMSNIDIATLQRIEENIVIPTIEQFTEISRKFDANLGDPGVFFWTTILRNRNGVNVDNIGVLTIGFLIRKTRELKGFHMREVAEYAGIDVPTISKIELGELTPTPEQFDKVCDFLQISPDNKKDYGEVYFGTLSN